VLRTELISNYCCYWLSHIFTLFYDMCNFRGHFSGC